MIDTIWNDGGALTGLVNNAAGNFISPTKDISPKGFEAISNIVFRGSFYLTHACGTRWIEARGQRIGYINPNYLDMEWRAFYSSFSNVKGRGKYYD